MSGPEKAYQETVTHILRSEEVVRSGVPNSISTLPRTTGMPGAPGLSFRDVYFFDSTVQTQYSYTGMIPRVGPLPPWNDSKRGEAKAGSLMIDAPDRSGFNAVVIRMMWSIGRGYSEHINKVTKVKERPDGLQEITADGTDITKLNSATWELVVDPRADYLVRSASLYDGRFRRSIITISNSGIAWYGPLCLPVHSDWKDNRLTREYRIEISSASTEPDMDLIRHAKDLLQPPYYLPTDVIDLRVHPALIKQYTPNTTLPKKERKKLAKSQSPLFGRAR